MITKHIAVPEGESPEGVLLAFAQGYHDGRVLGYQPGDDTPPYDDSVLRHFYKRGYDAGIADYCAVDGGILTHELQGYE